MKKNSLNKNRLRRKSKKKEQPKLLFFKTVKKLYYSIKTTHYNQIKPVH